MKLAILGTRGIPASHGGFETFAEDLSLYLKSRAWEVTVYCQEKGDCKIYEDEWNGIRRVHIPITQDGAKGTIIFDWKATLHAAKAQIPVLTLGYNTAVFCALFRFQRIKNIINMDGLEWRRDKWSVFEKIWLLINERVAVWIGNHLVADHPEIKKHLSQFVSPKKITLIPYSAFQVDTADENYLTRFNLKKNNYALIVARPEPENLVLEMIRAFSNEKRSMPLVVLGKFNSEDNRYHRKIIRDAGHEVQFVGAIYDKPIVQSLRYFARLCIHGHTVGGTNPSLVEALGAGCPILAHDNKFNRWVAGDGACYFSTENQCDEKLSAILGDDKMVSRMRAQSRNQFASKFSIEETHKAYEQIFKEHLN